MPNYFLHTSVFSGSSEIFKVHVPLLFNRKLYVNMGGDRDGLLLLDGIVWWYAYTVVPTFTSLIRRHLSLYDDMHIQWSLPLQHLWSDDTLIVWWYAYTVVPTFTTSLIRRHLSLYDDMHIQWSLPLQHLWSEDTSLLRTPLHEPFHRNTLYDVHWLKDTFY